MLKKYGIWISIALVIAGVFLFYFGTRSLLIVTIDGIDRTVLSHGFTVGSALASANIPFHTEDRVMPAINSLLPKSGKVQVISAKSIHILLQPGNVWVQVLSADNLPGNILLSAGLRLFPGDEIYYNGVPVSAFVALPLAADFTLQVRIAQPITITKNGQEITIHSGSFNLIQGLVNAGLLLNPSDQFSNPLNSSIAGPSQETFNPAPLLHITYQGETLTGRSAAPTIGQALADSGISLQDLDYTIPAEDQPVPADGNIRVVAVTDDVKVNQIARPFSTEYTVDSTVELDTTKVIVPGQYGLEVSRQHIFMEDGKETSRVTEPSVVLSKPVNAVVARGGKVVVKTLETPSGTIQYYRSITVHATSYSPCESDTGVVGQCMHGTSSRTQVRVGEIAVSLAWFKLLQFDTVYIPGYGVASIEDVGGGAHIWRYWIDLGYDDASYVPWDSDVTIYFLWPMYAGTPPIALP
jgi:resuscitation-promoting factor RpfB